MIYGLPANPSCPKLSQNTNWLDLELPHNFPALNDNQEAVGFFGTGDEEIFLHRLGGTSSDLF